MAKTKINAWAGLFTAVSPYSLPPGANVRQNNLQINRPGELQPRDGMDTVYTAQDYDEVIGVYRVSNGTSTADTLLVASKPDANTTVIRYLTPVEGGGENEWTTTTVHTVSTTETASPVFAEDRHGRIHTFFGNGVSPAVIDRSASPAQSMGVPAPTSAPTVTPTGNGYFIERVDVVDGGGSYWSPPPVVVSGGSPIRGARLKTVIQGGSVVAVDVIDGGTGYTSPPTLTVNESGVKGVGFLGYGIIGVDPGLQGFEPAISTTGNITNASVTVTNVAGISAVKVGMAVRGTGIQSNATVATVNASTSTFTMNLAATATASNQPLVINGAGVTGTTNASLSHGYDVTPGSTSIAYLSGATTASVAATYDSGASLWTALIPLTAGTNSVTGAQSVGSGAYARVNFSPLTGGLSYGVNTTTTQDATWPVKPAGAFFGTSANTMLTPTNSSPYTAADYWRNTDDNTAYAANNTAPTTWQTHRWLGNNWDFFAALAPNFKTRFHKRRVYAGRIAGGVDPYPLYADIYTYDYSRISLRYYTGTRAELESGTDTADKWVWTTATVAVADGQPYIDVELIPSLKTGSTPYATYSDYQTPIVRIFLKYCPDSWLNSTTTAGDSLNAINLGWQRTGAGASLTSSTNLGWWSAGAAESGVAQRPIVDFRSSSSGDAAAGIAAGTIQVVRPGSGMEQDTFFAIQFDQVNAAVVNLFASSGKAFTNFYDNGAGNPYAHKAGNDAEYALGWAGFEVNPVSPAFTNEYYTTTNPARLTKPFTDYRVRFYFRAGSPAAGQVGPPGPVYGAPSVVIPGTGYLANDRASFTLRQRSNLTDPAASATFSTGQTYTFSGIQITAASSTSKVTGVAISSTGSGYYGSPDLIVSGGGGFGLKAAATVSGGAITAVTIQDSGSGFTSAPTITASAQTARLLPVMRPAMRGTYRCAYRFADWSKTLVDNRVISTTSGSPVITMANTAGLAPDMVVEHSSVPFQSRIVSIVGTQVTLSAAATATVASATAAVRDMTKPIYYSNFSPITDVDTTLFPASPNPTQMIWSIAGTTAPERATIVEFFRTSSDESLVFYRLEMYGTVAGGTVAIQSTDTLTDEELFDSSRPFYAAVPVVLPNGNLNAYRFGVPRADMAACASYGDRLWYGVSTSGEEANTVFFSEYDEFESCPAINDLPIQNNQKTTDSLTALIPFSTYLLAMQTSHCYAITYNSDPAVDANVNLMATRGCLSQQCFDLYDDRLFVMDERGVYVMDRSGNVEVLSEAIADYFYEGRLDFSRRKRFFLKVDQRTGILRAFVVVTGSNATTPHMAFCYKIANKTWWTETWPNGLTASCDYRRDFGSPDEPIYGAVDGDVYRAGGLRDQQYRTIASVTLTGGGSGYVSAPTVTVSTGQNGCGAEFKALIVDGAVTEILIVEGGFGYGSFSGLTFVPAVSLTIEPPPAGGTTATASATATLPIREDQTYPQATVPYLLKTAPMDLVGDANIDNKNQMQDRSVEVSYRPTDTACVLNLREYYNNSDMPRRNAMPRNRGTGFVHVTSGAKSTLDMVSTRSPLGLSTGVAKAQFAGRAYSDMSGADRDVALELSGDAVPANAGDAEPSRPLIYDIEVSGVAVNGN